MACFTVPLAEALITTAVTLVVEKKMPEIGQKTGFQNGFQGSFGTICPNGQTAP